jgi:hypothetical protein
LVCVVGAVVCVRHMSARSRSWVLLSKHGGRGCFIRATIYLACVLECGVVSSRREKPVAEIFDKTSEWSGGKGEAECVNRLPPIFICAHIRAPGVTRQV